MADEKTSSNTLNDEIHECFANIRKQLEKLEKKIIERDDETKELAKKDLLFSLDMMYTQLSANSLVRYRKSGTKHQQAEPRKGPVIMFQGRLVHPNQKSSTEGGQVSSNEVESDQEMDVNSKEQTQSKSIGQVNMVVAVDPKQIIADSDDEGNHTITKSVRGSNPRHKCPTCGQVFTQRGSLIRHIRAHSNYRPEQCPTCNKRFADKERLKVHMRTHTGEKPFSCHICGASFSQRSTVTRHMSVHKPKSFNCNSCPKTFASKNSLHVHAKNHHPDQHAKAMAQDTHFG